MKTSARYGALHESHLAQWEQACWPSKTVSPAAGECKRVESFPFTFAACITLATFCLEPLVPCNALCFCCCCSACHPANVSPLSAGLLPASPSRWVAGVAAAASGVAAGLHLLLLLPVPPVQRRLRAGGSSWQQQQRHDSRRCSRNSSYGQCCGERGGGGEHGKGFAGGWKVGRECALSVCRGCERGGGAVGSSSSGKAHGTAAET